jgi:D-3-phosphoglycerate dehydrogenase
MPKILVTDRLAASAMVQLKGEKSFEILRSETPEIKPSELVGINGLLVRSKTKITEEHLSSAKDLQVIITSTSGFDHIDLAACAKWGITVMYTPSPNANTAAQLTLALALACVHKITQGHGQVKSGTWKREGLVSMELTGKTWGVVGLGRIGKKVAELAQAFGMETIAFDPYLEDGTFREAATERVAFEELLKRSDVLSFHVPLTKETFHMMNRSHFEYIRRGIVLLNSSRGSVIKEEDLVEALKAGWISACGLDVFEKEPLPRNSHLLQEPNVIFTPHVGAHSTEAFTKSGELAVEKLITFFRNGETSDTLPPKAAWFAFDGVVRAFT